MAATFLWCSIAIFILFLLVGFLAGFLRGLKRSAIHVAVLAASIVLSIFITKPITNAVLQISINFNGTQGTIGDIVFNVINNISDITSYDSFVVFAKTIPLSLVSTVVFIFVTLVTYFLFDMIYLVVARFALGKKKDDFAEHKPRRWYGALVGVAEGFMLMFFAFAPLGSMTNMYAQLKTYTLPETVQSQGGSIGMFLPSVQDVVDEFCPKAIDDTLMGYNQCLLAKFAGAGGLNNALFDFFSTTTMNGERIPLRNDLLAVADSYNTLAITFDTYATQSGQEVDFDRFRASINNFLDCGFYRGVVAPTAKDFVVSYQPENAPEFLKSLDVVPDLLMELKPTFSAEDFDPKTYIKEDILRVFDIAQSGVLSHIGTISKGNPLEIVDLVSNNSDQFLFAIDNVLQLHIVEDGVTTIGGFLSDKLTLLADNPSVALNLSSDNKKQMLEKTREAIHDVLVLNEKIPFSTFVKGDVLENLSKVEDLEQVLLDAGKTFDKLRNLEVLQFPQESSTLYVFDEVLKELNISLLGDTVQDKTIGTDGKIDGYEAFFKLIAQPIGQAQKLDLLKIQNGDFQKILNKVLDEISESGNTKLLSQILLPFFELKNATFNLNDPNASIRGTVFDEVIYQLDENISQISFKKPKAEDSYDVWKAELDKLGEVLQTLDNKDSTISLDGKQYTYIRYLLAKKSNVSDLIDKIVDDGKLQSVLEKIFASAVCEPFTENIFKQLDSAIEKITEAKPTTDHTNLKGHEEDVAAILQSLLEFANDQNNQNLNNVDLEKIGEILEKCKKNAFNEGQKDGVLRAVFENLIWYLTGDDITDGKIYAEIVAQNKFADSDTIKEYLQNKQATINYYDVDFAQSFKEIKESLDFVEALRQNGIRTFEINKQSEQTIAESITTFLSKFDIALKTLGDEQNQSRILTNTKRLIDCVSKEGNILSEQDSQTKEKLATQINAQYSSTLAEAIIALLGL